MKEQRIRAKFMELSIPETLKQDLSVVIPTVKGTLLLKYGKHAYYFLNFKTLRGFSIEISHYSIIRVGLKRFSKANARSEGSPSRFRQYFLQKYHYGFNFVEQVMLMTVPHTITDIGDSRFIVNLWSYFGYLEVDCRNKTVIYRITAEDEDDDHVLGSAQWYDKDTDELYYMTYSLKDSLKRVQDPYNSVAARILKKRKEGNVETVWQGDFADYAHELLVNKTKQYCVMCELGMFLDKKNEIIPSKVLILDLKNDRRWMIEKFIVAAHAQFDPNEPDIIYFSNHNFNFIHGSVYKVMKKASYIINFRGPASVYKYRLTEDGPKELGVFTEPGFMRLTNMHVFNHRDQKLLAAMGAPNFIYIVDAETMESIRRIEVKHPVTFKHLYRNIPCIIGSFSPSFDGEKLFVQTTRSTQMVDVAGGEAEVILDHFFNHSSSNHMLTSHTTDW